ncbi:hypothetical protein VPH35_053279 [Triticum aestivum]|uniref:3'-5' exonuclease domain-containing protein n=1 Tax=Triticum aestivum TaxID=4565 RepID=A0A077S3J9_WHEAT|nr:unnamed protein product [Triticum aestivum]
MAAVLQLCVKELCLVYHITTATTWPKRLKQFLREENFYTFASFSIEGDKKMLNKFGLEINPNNFIDMQCKWKVPTTNKHYDSLVDVATSVIHPFYKGMKQNFNKEEDHKLWGTSPLPDNLIESAAKDAYATYKSWKIIDNIVTGWDIAQEQEAAPTTTASLQDEEA